MAEMTITSAKVEMSSAQITYDGTDLGETSGGITFNYTQGYTIFKPDQTTMAEKPFLIDEAVTVTVPLAEYQTSNFLVAAPAGTRTTDGPKELVKYGGGSVDTSDLKQLILTPVTGGSGTLNTDANLKLTIYKALCTEAVDITFDREAPRIIQCTFMAFRDSSQAAGFQLFWFGDITT